MGSRLRGNDGGSTEHGVHGDYRLDSRLRGNDGRGGGMTGGAGMTGARE